MAKKTKGKNSGNPVLNALTEILNGMSPEEKMMLMADLENFASSGRSLDDEDEDWDYPLSKMSDEDDERDADALFYKECGLKPAKSKSGKSNSKSARKGK